MIVERALADVGNYKKSFIYRRLVQTLFADKPTSTTKMSRPRITQGDRVSASMLGEIIRKINNRNKQ